MFFSHNPPPTPSLRKTRRQEPGGAWPERGQLNPGEKELKPAPSHFPTLYNSPGNKQEGLLPFTLGKFKDFLWSGGTVPETPGATVGGGQEGNPGWAGAPPASPLLTGSRPLVLCLQNLQLGGQGFLGTLEDTWACGNWALLESQRGNLEPRQHRLSFHPSSISVRDSAVY